MVTFGRHTIRLQTSSPKERRSLNYAGVMETFLNLVLIDLLQVSPIFLALILLIEHTLSVVLLTVSESRKVTLRVVAETYISHKEILNA